MKGVVKGGIAPRKYLANRSAVGVAVGAGPSGNEGVSKEAPVCCVVERFRQPMNLLIGAVPRKPPMVPTGVVGVIAVGVDGSVVRSAKALVPFLPRFTGHGVESGDGNPSINRFKVAVP